MSGPLRLFVPLQLVATGIGNGLDLWEALPPIEHMSLWLVELHCEGYAPEAQVADLAIYTPQPTSEFVRLLPLAVPAMALDPTRPEDFRRLPQPPKECKASQRICARTSGRIRRLIVVCTNREGALCPTSSPS